MIAELSHFIATQPMFVGLVGATLTGAGLYTLRQAPKTLFEHARNTFTVQLTIEQRDEAFLHVTQWLAGHRASRKARRLMMAEIYDWEKGDWGWNLTLGRGWHLLRHGRTWIFVQREVKEGSELAQLVGGAGTQRLWLFSVGRKQGALRDLISQSREAYFGGGLVNVHVYDGGWICVDRRRPRPLDTVFMPAAQKSRVMEDITRFLAARADYAKRGVPWRRGYLFKGPPGTGKSTLIFAAAGHLGKPIYVLNLNNVRGDNDLIAAFNQIDRNGVVVIEDIDTFEITANRDTPPAEPSPIPSATPLSVSAVAPSQKVTLSGLLNAIDGIAAREGRLLFITSNKAEVLDPALVRPGRIDIVEEIGLLGRGEAASMIRAFSADAGLVDTITLPIAAATLQGILLREEEGQSALHAVERDRAA